MSNRKSPHSGAGIHVYIVFSIVVLMHTIFHYNLCFDALMYIYTCTVSLIFAEDVMWSKLDSGRLPSLSEVKSLVTNHIHDLQAHDTSPFAD